MVGVLESLLCDYPSVFIQAGLSLIGQEYRSVERRSLITIASHFGGASAASVLRQRVTMGKAIIKKSTYKREEPA